MIGILMLAAAGQVAKFDDRTPAATFRSVAALEDIERCLIRWGSPPQVYRQPDRPADVSIVWVAGGVSAGNAAGRVDLHKGEKGTEVISWMPASVVDPCAPR